MKIKIHSPHLTVSQHLKDFINEKISSADHIVHSNIDHADVYLNLESQAKIKDKIVELKVHYNKQDIFIKKHSETFEDATLQVANVLKITIDKSNKKLRDKKRNGLRKALKKLFFK